jgi:SAM-dependent methyltransferase
LSSVSDQVQREPGRPTRRRAAITLLDALPTFATGQTSRLRMALVNTGSARWPRHLRPPCVSYHWLTKTGECLVRAGKRTRLRQSVAPGGRCEVTAKVVSPSTTGDFWLEIDLVIGDDGWFGDGGSPTLRLDVHVARGATSDFDHYEDAWEKADLDRNHWSIVGPGSRDEFDALSRTKRDLLIRHGLTPTARVLDVGCGTGLLAQGLLDYLDDGALYVGTDISAKAVAFCRRRYRRPNFRFAVNEQTRVPIEEDGFHFVTLFSVFTHLFPEEVGGLASSLRSRLAPQGVLLADAFTVESGPEWAGSRAKVDILRSTLESAFDRAGLRIARAEVLVEEGDVTRRLYRLERRDG